MAQFAPHLIRSRRRQFSCRRASSGIALLSFRLNDAHGVDASAEPLLLPVSAAFVAYVFGSFFTFHFSEASEKFINRLARHPDARLRAAAAGVENALKPEIAEKLAEDPAYAVRRALSQNDDALGKLSGTACTRLAETDSNLAEDVVTTLERNARRAAREHDAARTHSQTERTTETSVAALEKLRVVIDAFRNHSDYVVRAAVLDAEDTLREIETGDAAFDSVSTAKHRKRQMLRDRRCGFIGNPGEYGLGFVFLDQAAFAEGIVKAEVDSPLFIIPVDAYDGIIRDLPSGESSEILLERFATNGCATVREAVADSECLPKAAVDLLKADANYEVRANLLRNDSIRTELSAEDILGLVRGDAGLLRDALEYSDAGTRVRRILFEAFDNAEDPGITEFLDTLSRLGD